MNFIVSGVSCLSIGGSSRSVSESIPGNSVAVVQSNGLTIEPVLSTSVINISIICLSSDIARIKCSNTSASESSQEVRSCETRTVGNSACYPTELTSTYARLNMEIKRTRILELIDSTRSVVNCCFCACSTYMRNNFDRNLTTTDFCDDSLQVTIKQRSSTNTSKNCSCGDCLSNSKTNRQVEVANSVLVSSDSSKTAVSSRRESKNSRCVNTSDDLVSKTIKHSELDSI